MSVPHFRRLPFPTSRSIEREGNRLKLMLHRRYVCMYVIIWYSKQVLVFLQTKFFGIQTSACVSRDKNWLKRTYSLLVEHTAAAVTAVFSAKQFSTASGDGKNEDGGFQQRGGRGAGCVYPPPMPPGGPGGSDGRAGRHNGGPRGSRQVDKRTLKAIHAYGGVYYDVL